MAVANVKNPVFSMCRWVVERPDDPVNNVVDIRKIARHLSIAIDFNRLAAQDFLRETEIGHIGPSPWAIDSEEAQASLRKAVEFGIALGLMIVVRIETSMGRDLYAILLLILLG